MLLWWTNKWADGRERTLADVKTEGNGTPLSPGPWGSLPGPELSKSRRLDPSGLDWAILGPSNKLLKSLGLETEGFDRAPRESRPNGGRLSRFIMERSEPDSGRASQEDGDSSVILISIYTLRLGFHSYPWCHPWLFAWPNLPTSEEQSCCPLPTSESLWRESGGRYRMKTQQGRSCWCSPQLPHPRCLKALLLV